MVTCKYYHDDLARRWLSLSLRGLGAQRFPIMEQSECESVPHRARGFCSVWGLDWARLGGRLEAQQTGVTGVFAACMSACVRPCLCSFSSVSVSHGGHS